MFIFQIYLVYLYGVSTGFLLYFQYLIYKQNHPKVDKSYPPDEDRTSEATLDAGAPDGDVVYLRRRSHGNPLETVPNGMTPSLGEVISFTYMCKNNSCYHIFSW